MNQNAVFELVARHLEKKGFYDAAKGMRELQVCERSLAGSLDLDFDLEMSELEVLLAHSLQTGGNKVRLAYLKDGMAITENTPDIDKSDIFIPLLRSFPGKRILFSERDANLQLFSAVFPSSAQLSGGQKLNLWEDARSADDTWWDAKSEHDESRNNFLKSHKYWNDEHVSGIYVLSFSDVDENGRMASDVYSVMTKNTQLPSQGFLGKSYTGLINYQTNPNEPKKLSVESVVDEVQTMVSKTLQAWNDNYSGTAEDFRPGFNPNDYLSPFMIGLLTGVDITAQGDMRMDQLRALGGKLSLHTILGLPSGVFYNGKQSKLVRTVPGMVEIVEYPFLECLLRISESSPSSSSPYANGYNGIRGMSKFHFARAYSNELCSVQDPIKSLLDNITTVAEKDDDEEGEECPSKNKSMLNTGEVINPSLVRMKEGGYVYSSLTDDRLLTDAVLLRQMKNNNQPRKKGVVMFVDNAKANKLEAPLDKDEEPKEIAIDKIKSNGNNHGNIQNKKSSSENTHKDKAQLRTDFTKIMGMSERLGGVGMGNSGDGVNPCSVSERLLVRVLRDIDNDALDATEQDATGGKPRSARARETTHGGLDGLESSSSDNNFDEFNQVSIDKEKYKGIRVELGLENDIIENSPQFEIEDERQGDTASEEEEEDEEIPEDEDEDDVDDIEEDLEVDEEEEDFQDAPEIGIHDDGLIEPDEGLSLGKPAPEVTKTPTTESPRRLELVNDIENKTPAGLCDNILKGGIERELAELAANDGMGAVDGGADGGELGVGSAIVFSVFDKHLSDIQQNTTSMEVMTPDAVGPPLCTNESKLTPQKVGTPSDKEKQKDKSPGPVRKTPESAKVDETSKNNLSDIANTDIAIANEDSPQISSTINENGKGDASGIFKFDKIETNGEGCFIETISSSDGSTDGGDYTDKISEQSTELDEDGNILEDNSGLHNEIKVFMNTEAGGIEGLRRQIVGEPDMDEDPDSEGEITNAMRTNFALRHRAQEMNLVGMDGEEEDEEGEEGGDEEEESGEGRDIELRETMMDNLQTGSGGSYSSGTLNTQQMTQSSMSATTTQATGISQLSALIKGRGDISNFSLLSQTVGASSRIYASNADSLLPSRVGGTQMGGTGSYAAASLTRNSGKHTISCPIPHDYDLDPFVCAMRARALKALPPSMAANGGGPNEYIENVLGSYMRRLSIEMNNGNSKSFKEEQSKMLEQLTGHIQTSMPVIRSLFTSVPAIASYGLPIYFAPYKSGFEDGVNMVDSDGNMTNKMRITHGMLLGYRYVAQAATGEAAFSNTIECLDLVRIFNSYPGVAAGNPPEVLKALSDEAMKMHVKKCGCYGACCGACCNFGSVGYKTLSECEFSKYPNRGTNNNINDPKNIMDYGRERSAQCGERKQMYPKVCVKVIKNDKDYLDQSLDEIKLLKCVNRFADKLRYYINRSEENWIKRHSVSINKDDLNPLSRTAKQELLDTLADSVADTFYPNYLINRRNGNYRLAGGENAGECDCDDDGDCNGDEGIGNFGERYDPPIVHLIDYFYCREHLHLVFDLCGPNLYEFDKLYQDSSKYKERYFTVPIIKTIYRQLMEAVRISHSLGIIHADLKPENILVKYAPSYENRKRDWRLFRIKLIDFGSASFASDELHTYVQSRSYRAPEVLLGLPYDGEIDIWSCGCMLYEFLTGNVLFPNEEVIIILCRMIGTIGHIPRRMLIAGKYSYKFFTRSFVPYLVSGDEAYYINPKRKSLEALLDSPNSKQFVSFNRYLLQIDPEKRPTAEQALKHPFLATDEM